MSANNPIQNTKKYIAGIHQFINVGTGSTSVAIPDIVSQSDVQVMTIQNGNVGIGVTNPSSTLDVNGTITTSNLIVLNAYTTNYQIAPIRNVTYVESSSNSDFTLTQSGYFGGNASNVLVYVDNLKKTYYTDAINDYTLAVTYNDITNTTLYNIHLTTPAVFGSIVDITVWPQILQESLPNPMRLYQRVDVQSDFISTGFNIYYMTGNVGIGTTTPLQSLHVQNQSYFVGNVGIGTTIVQNTGGGLHIIAPEGPDTNGACAQLIVENGATDIGGADEDARIIIKSKQAGESDLIMYNIDDSVISWGKIGWLGSTIYLQTGTTDAINDATDVARLNEKISYFPSANVGIGTTNPDVRLLVGENTTRDEIIKVNSQGFAGLILNGDTANTAGEAGGAYIWLRQDAAATTATIALTQIAGEDGRGNSTLTGSTANALVLSHGNNYPIQFGINGQVLMEVDTDASVKFYTTDNIYCGKISTVTGADNLYVTGDDILFLESGGGGTTNQIRSLTIYNSTTASGGNVFVNSAGTLSRSTSSIRYKKDVVTLEDSIADRILTCRPIKYKSINPKDEPVDWTYYGFIAEEVALIEPRLVTYDQNNEPDGVQYDRFIPSLLNIIQRQQTRIQTLESTVQQLQSDYNNLIQTLQNKNILP